MRYKTVLLSAIVVLIAIGTANGYVHAAGNSTGTTAAPVLSDQQTEVVIIATIVGGLTAPIAMWAGSEVNKTSGQRDKFDWGQYALAAFISVIGTFGLIMTELTTVTFTGTNLQAYAIVFLMAFMNGLGVNTVKKLALQSMTNRAIQANK